MAFAAKYPNECGDCGNAIVVGQQVTFQGPDNLVHDRCPTPAPVCPRCFIEMPGGECGNCD